jgi:hydroxylamine reductase
MFCYQCQETARGLGCTRLGVCGKNDEVAALQDLLIYLLKGIGTYGVRARELEIVDPEADSFVAQALFSTITNANFDPQRFVSLVERALELREGLAKRFLAAYACAHGKAFSEELPEMATWVPEKGDLPELLEKGRSVGIMANPDLDEDVRSLRELLVYGLKGMGAYIHHAEVLGFRDEGVSAFLHEALAASADDTATVAGALATVQRCGQMGVEAMALLDRANKATYGDPEHTQVNLGVREGPAIQLSSAIRIWWATMGDPGGISRRNSSVSVARS